MKLLALLILSAMFASCASQDRKVASQEKENLEQTERIGDFEPGYRH